MNQNEQVILSQSDIHDGFKTVGEYKIYLEWETGGQEIRIRIEESAKGYFEFSQSHHVKTPLQGHPYHPSNTRNANQNDLLRHAIDRTLDFYQQTVKAGHKPSSDWFVKNEDY